MNLKFAHLADCHLGGWRQEELQELNFQSFQKSLDRCIEENVNFILISGDLFDSAYPPIEILKKTFAEFRKIKEANIPVYLIAGSHDFSASGKTFLDVLEKAGFCKNIESTEEQEDGVIQLQPHIHENIAIYGYSGKKSSMEIQDIQKIKFTSSHPLTIFMLHTTISDVVGSIPMDSINKKTLPLADYYALGHIHKVFQAQEPRSLYVYPGPIFPNNFQELADLKQGSFQLVKIENSKLSSQNIKIKLKDVVYAEIEIQNALTATEKIISTLDKFNMNNKIVLMKLTGTITQGKSGDIRFEEIEAFVKKKQAYSFIRNISSLKTEESGIQLEIDNIENLEEKIIQEYSEQNPSDFNKILPQLINVLSIEKNEDEKSAIFESRLMSEAQKILNLPI